jgi:pimeloyl-ACP methyl ester carboxylesterase
MPYIASPTPRRLVLFPGLGASARLFDLQRTIPATLEVPPWIEPLRRETLADYARRLASTLRPDPPFYLGGCSFGGMIALEAARHVKPLAVILIASCRTPLSVNQAILGCAPLANAMPAWIARLSARSSPPSLRDLVAASPELLRWGPAAITRWRGVEQLDAPIFRVHGACDRIIPLRQVRPDQVIRTGGHLINLTHAREVNAFIEHIFDEVEQPRIS